MKSFQTHITEKAGNGTVDLYKKDGQGGYTADDENHDCEEEHPGVSHKKWVATKEEVEEMTQAGDAAKLIRVRKKQKKNSVVIRKSGKTPEDQYDYLIRKSEGKPVNVPKKNTQTEEVKHKVGDTVTAKKGPHKGVRHTVIHDHGDGKYNIRPVGLSPRQISYRLGAATSKGSDLEPHKRSKNNEEIDPFTGQPIDETLTDAQRNAREKSRTRTHGGVGRTKTKDDFGQTTTNRGEMSRKSFALRVARDEKRKTKKRAATSRKDAFAPTEEIDAFTGQPIEELTDSQRGAREASRDSGRIGYKRKRSGLSDGASLARRSDKLQAYRPKEMGLSKSQRRGLNRTMGQDYSKTYQAQKGRRDAEIYNKEEVDYIDEISAAELKKWMDKNPDKVTVGPTRGKPRTSRKVKVKGGRPTGKQLADRAEKKMMREGKPSAGEVMAAGKADAEEMEKRRVARGGKPMAQRNPQHPEYTGKKKMKTKETTTKGGIRLTTTTMEAYHNTLSRMASRTVEVDEEIKKNPKFYRTAQDRIKGAKPMTMSDKEVDSFNKRQKIKVKLGKTNKDIKHTIKDVTPKGYGPSDEEYEIYENVAYLKNKEGHTFVVSKRDTTGMRGKQDKFSMSVVDKKGKTIEDHGSHVSVAGAKKFASSRGFSEEVEMIGEELVDEGARKLYRKAKRKLEDKLHGPFAKVPKYTDAQLDVIARDSRSGPNKKDSERISREDRKRLGLKSRANEDVVDEALNPVVGGGFAGITILPKRSSRGGEVKEVGKGKRGSKTEYWWKHKSGLKNVFDSLEKLRYSLRNDANFKDAEEITKQLGEAVSVDGRTKGYRDAISRIAARHKVVTSRDVGRQPEIDPADAPEDLEMPYQDDPDVVIEAKNLYADGATVKVVHPQRGKGVVKGKVVRHDKGMGSSGSPFYVVAIPGVAQSVKVSDHNMIKENAEEILDEAKAGKIMKQIRGQQGPYTVVVMDGKKVVDQHIVKIPTAVPAAVKVARKEFPGAKIAVEGGGGTILHTEAKSLSWVKPGTNPNLRAADPKDIEMDDYLKNASLMIGRGSRPDEVRASIQKILPMLKKRGIKLTPKQKAGLKKLGIKEEFIDEGGLGGGTKSNVTKTGTHSSNLNYITRSKGQGWSDRDRSSAKEKKLASKEARRAGKQEVEVDEAKLRIPKETGTPGMTKARGPKTPYEKSKAFIAAHIRDNKGKYPTQAQHDKAIKEDEKKQTGAENVITKYKKRAADARQWKKDNNKTSLGIEETANVGDKNAPATSQDINYLSDFHKDVYGVRPRGTYKHVKTVGDYQKEIKSLSKAAEAEQQQVKQDRLDRKKGKAVEKKVQKKRTFGPKGGTSKTTLTPAFKKALAKSRNKRR